MLLNARNRKYYQYLKQRGLKPITIKNYLWQLDKFLLSQKTSSYTRASLKKYQSQMLEKYHNIASLNLHFTVLNDYLKFINNQYRLPLLSPQNLPKQILSPKQLEAFFQILSNQEDLLSQRNRLLIEILYYSGLKVNQVVKLKIQDLDYIKRELMIAGQKININPLTWHHIQKYLKLRHDQNPYLFANYDRSQKSEQQYLSVRSVERIIDKYAKQLKPPLLINPKILRHTLAWQIKQNGGQAQDIQKNLNLASASSTKKYWQNL